MSKFQAHWYKSEVARELESGKEIQVGNNFYVRSRQRANIVFPKGLVGDEGLDSLTPALIRDELETYSCKLAYMMNKIKRKTELTFIYSQWTNQYGIKALRKILDVYGYKDYWKYGPGKHRYVIWSGDETKKQKRIIKAVYNASANDDCSQIELVIGSAAIKEGVSLFRTRRAFVLDPYWNHSRLAQIFGRVSRYCSHKTLPSDQRDVKIYMLVAVVSKTSRGEVPSAEKSIDAYMLDIADKKLIINEPYIDEMISLAVDRGLFGK
jgi:hypothetical protein